jgi:hypothetical protein
LSQELAFVVEDLDAMRAIIADEYLVSGVRAAAAVGELEVLGAVELVQDGAHQVEDDDTHDLALDDHDAVLRVYANASRVLKDVGAEFAKKVTVLVVDLDLVCGRAFGDYDVARLLHYCHSVRVEQLALTFTALAEFELETALRVEDLDAVRVRVRYDNVVVGVYANLFIRFLSWF